MAANVALPDPAGVEIVPVGTTAELRDATLAAAVDADVVIMAAAPADYRPVRYQPQKIKKDGAAPTLELVTNPDIAAELGATRRPGQLLVIFAAETHDAVASGRAKLARKRADLVVVNEVGEGRAFGTDDNAATVLDADGKATELSARPKEELADAVWDLVRPLLG